MKRTKEPAVIDAGDRSGIHGSAGEEVVFPSDLPFIEAVPGSTSCHGGPQVDTGGLPLVAIVGSPNVGKSVLFNILTGAYVTVSNYPGTTVEVSRGKGRLSGITVGVVDTPGMYRLMPLTEEERVARDILLQERPAVILHVVDVKNLDRMLPMTLQLVEAGLRVILVANLMDEAERLGVQVDLVELGHILGIPVIGTALAFGRGAEQVKELVVAALQADIDPSALSSTTSMKCAFCPTSAGAVETTPSITDLVGSSRVQYPLAVENALHQIEHQMDGTYRLSKRALALLLLQNDAGVEALVSIQEGARYTAIKALVTETQAQYSQPLSYVLARVQREAASRILADIIHIPDQRRTGFAGRLSEAMMNPLTGLPILALALLLLYEFVGVLGAQTLVGFLEGTLFGEWVNPWVDRILTALIPWEVVRNLFGGEFGVITLGVRYAVALILPIVGTFFLAFSVIEDSGYLPRLAMLIDRVFKKIGLNGRAVIPMVLGFGCDTMATIVTRTLETPRERVLSTILLSLAIPCSAQLGVMLGMLGGNPALMVIWTFIIAGIFLLVGLLAAKLVPGQRPIFYMELPPLRLPTLKNVVVKTYTRMEWYFREVFPTFIFASLIIWFGKVTGLFDLAVSALLPLVRGLGLPDASAVAFLFGFFRRDYGAAGLYDLRDTMSGVQILVATVTMTLFVPCVAQFSVTVKERGWKTALGIILFIFPFAFLVGGLLSWVLRALGIKL